MNEITRRRMLSGGAGLAVAALTGGRAVADAASPASAPAPSALGDPAAVGLTGFLPQASRADLRPSGRWRRHTAGLQAAPSLVYSSLSLNGLVTVDDGRWRTGVDTDASTFEAWIRFTAATDAAAGYGVLLGQCSTGGGMPLLWVNGSKITVFWGPETSPVFQVSASAPTALNDGQWHHVAVVFAQGVPTFYCDGATVGSADAVPYQDASTSISLILGGGAAGYAAMVGEIWNARIWSTARSASDIANHRWDQLGAGADPNLRFSSSFAPNQVGNAVDGYAGTPMNASTLPTDVPVAAYGIVPAPYGISFIGVPATGYTSDAVTFECWMRLTGGASQAQTLLCVENSGLTDLRPRICYAGGDQIGYDWGGESATSTGGQVVSDGAWHHVAVVFDRGSVTFYKDGVAVGPPAVMASGPQQSGVGSFLTLGTSAPASDSLPASGVLQGELFDVRVWSVARTPSEISSFRYATLAGTEQGLVSLIRGNPAAQPLTQIYDVVTNRSGLGGGSVGITPPTPVLPTQVWEYGLDGYAPAGPLQLPGGNVVCTDNANGTVLALDLKTNAMAWETTLPAQSPVLAQGGLVPSAVATDGTRVYVGRASNTEYQVVGLTALDVVTGKALWTWVSSGSTLSILTRPVVSDGVVYVGALTGDSNDPTLRVFAVDAAHGTSVGDDGLARQYPMGNSMTSVVSDGTSIYGASTNGTSSAVVGGPPTQPVGSWTHNMGGAIFADPVLAGAVLYVVAGTTVHALSTADGTPVWTPIELSAGSAQVYSRPVLVGTILLVGANDGVLYAVDTVAQKVIWTVETGSQIVTSLVLEDGIVYFANAGDGVTNGPAFFAVDTNSGGTGVLSYEVPGGDVIQFAEGGVGSGIVYFYSASTIYAVNMSAVVREIDVSCQLVVEDYDFGAPTRNGSPQGSDTSYRVTVTMRDENGVPRANQAVQLSTTTTLYLVNQSGGPTTLTSAGTWFETDAGGQLTVAISAYSGGVPSQATANVSCPPLLVWAPFLAVDESVVIYPDHDSLSTLSSVQGPSTAGSNNLQDAIGYDGTPMMQAAALQDPDSLTAVATAIRNTIGKVGSTGGGASSGTSPVSRTRVRGARLLGAAGGVAPTTNGTSTLRPYVPGDISIFTLTLSNGQAGLTTTFNPNAAVGHGVASPASLQGFEDFVHHVVNGAEHVVSVAWNAVENAAENAANAIIHTADSVYSFAVTSLEDAVTVVTGFLKEVVTDLAHVIEWLSYLFDWSDIVANHKILMTTITDPASPANPLNPTDPTNPGQLGAGAGALDLLYSYLATDRGSGAGGRVQGLAGNVQQTLTTVGTQAAGPDVRSVNATNGSPDVVWGKAGSNSSQCQWLQQKTKENMGSLGLTTHLTDIDTGPFTTAVQTLLDDLDNQLSADGDALQDAVRTQLTSLLDNFKDPQTLVSTGVDDILSILSTVGGQIVDLLEVVGHDLLVVLQSLIPIALQIASTPITIDFVSDLYQSVTGDQLTLLSLFTLIAAVPATIVTKALNSATAQAGAGRTRETDRLASSEVGVELVGIAGLLASIVATVADCFVLEQSLNDPYDDITTLSRFDFAANLVAYAFGLASAIQTNSVPFRVTDYDYWALQAVPLAFSGYSLINPEAISTTTQIVIDVGSGVLFATIAGIYAAYDEDNYLNPHGLTLTSNVLFAADLLIEVLVVLLDPDGWGLVALGGKGVLGAVASICGLFSTVEGLSS